MISYEKVKQSFRNFTILAIVINAIISVIYVFGLFSIFFIQANLKNPEFTKLYTAEQLAAIKLSITPFAIFMSSLALIIAIAIIIFSALNLSKVKKNDELSYVPHFLGTAISALNIIFSFTGKISILTLIIQAALIGLYYYTFTRAKLLNQRETNTEE